MHGVRRHAGGSRGFHWMSAVRLSGARKWISGKGVNKPKFNLGLDREIKGCSCLKISN